MSSLSRRRSVRLSNDEAVRRFHIILGKTRTDVEHALRVESSMVSANEVVSTLKDTRTDYASAYNAASYSMRFDFSITLARLFDNGGRRRKGSSLNKRDIASIPFLIRLLKQRRCRKSLIESGPECGPLIDRAVLIYKLEVTSAKATRIRRKLRSLRDHYLAHSLIREATLSDPSFNELYELMNAAGRITEAICSASDYEPYDFEVFRRLLREDAERFWSNALRHVGSPAAQVTVTP